MNYTVIANQRKFTVTASQLVSLLQILGALVADYSVNPKKPISPELLAIVKASQIKWKMLPSLQAAIQAAITGRDKVTALYELGAELKDAFHQHFHSAQDFTSQELQMLRAIRSYLSTDSETALNFIRKNAGIFENTKLASAFAPPIPQADTRSLQRSVKSLVGRDGVALSVDESRILSETDPEGYARYQALRKAHNNQFKATLTNYVRDRKANLVPYEDAYKEMVGLGFTHSMVPGFTGMIDDQGRWYTKDGKLLDGVPNLATYTNVVMNTGRDPEQQWVYKAVKGDGEVSYGYTSEFHRAQSRAKYEKVRILMTKIKSIRARWLAKVKNFDISDVDCVSAVVLEILYSYAARVGSAPGRGVGTLLAKNAVVTQQGINLAYLGKDSIRTRHVLKSTDPVQKLVIKALTELLEGKSGNEYIFSAFDGKKYVRCTPAMINAAFHRFGAPNGVTVHKLRTCRGTTLFKELVDQQAKKKPPVNEKEALAIYKILTEKVGKLLNHRRNVGESTERVTGTTAAGSYIDGSLQVELFRAWGFRVPKFLEALAQES